MTEEDQIPSGNQLRKEAALWFARMRGPDAEEHREGFERWLNRGAVHLGAYNRVSQVFNMGKYIETTNAPKPGYRFRPRLVAASLIILGMGIGCGVMLLHDKTQGDRAAQSRIARSETQSVTRYATLERFETVTLSDGSQVRLWPRSLLTVSMDHNVRSLRLEQGHGRFEVAHDGRKFVVLAGSGSVTALGTIFDVAIDSKARVTVHLARGAVEVRLPETDADGKSGTSVRRLSPGESVAFVPTTALVSPQTGIGPALEILARPQSFSAISLDDLVTLANRKGSCRIELADPALGQKRVSGIFRVDDPHDLSVKLARLFDLHADERNPQKIILKAQEAR